MYAFIWKKLPGNKIAKTLEAIALAAALIALLFFVIFPVVNDWISQLNPAVVAA